jgi:PST family polysaccharide transporter
MPLIVLPYLLRILGATEYGAIVMAQSLMAYAVVLTDFGFNLTAARDISVVRNDPSAVARIYWTTIAAKGLLMVVSLSLIACIVTETPAFRTRWPVFLACSLLVFGNVTFPQWYLQGLERLKDSALIQACAKLVSVLATFIFVRAPQDLWVAAILSSLPQLLGLAVATALRRPMFPATFYRPTWREICAALRGSWHMFASSLSTTLYGNTTTLVLGLMAGERVVALYSTSLRLVLALQGVGMPITQAVFPRASLLFAVDHKAAWRLVERTATLLLVAVGVCALLLGIFAPMFVRLLGGPSFVGAAPLVRIMVILPVMLCAGALPAQIVLVGTGKTKELAQIYLRTGIANLVLMPPLIYVFSAIGAALALIFAEALATAQMVKLALRQYRQSLRSS